MLQGFEHYGAAYVLTNIGENYRFGKNIYIYC